MSEKDKDKEPRGDAAEKDPVKVTEGGEPVVEAIREAAPPDKPKAEQAVFMEAAAVVAVLDAKRVHPAVRERLALRRYATEAELAEAIKAEVDYVKAVSGSGQVSGNEPRQEPAPASPVKVAEMQKALDKRLDEIDERF